MYQNLHEYVSLIISIFLCCISIKMLDDSIDEGINDYGPYIMVLTCLSIIFWNDSISLYFGSYIVGMFHDKNLRLISSLKTYHEQFIIFLLSIILKGFLVTISSLFIICTVQLADDLIDEKQDRYEGKKNWVVSLGRTEVAILALIFLILSMYLDLKKSLLSFTGAFLVSILFKDGRKAIG